MGIPGLLQGLKPYTQAGNIREFSGQAIAVDASSWLHKSIYPIAEHYVEATWGSSSSDSNGYSNSSGMDDDDPQQQQQQQKPPPPVSVDARSVQVSTDYMLKRCQELVQHAGIRHVYLVFDGKRCPLKAGTNAERERKRQEHLNDARKYKQLLLAASSTTNSNNVSHAQKQKYREQMFHHYKTCIKVTQALADAVADKLQQHCRNNINTNNSRNSRSCGFELVFAPYEADSQLVQLVVAGLAQAVVTEDSDVLVYSAACQHAFPTLFKLDRQTGCCQIISMDWLLLQKTADSGSSSNNKTASRNQKQPPRRSALLPMTAAERESSSQQQGHNSQLENILTCFAERQGRGAGSRLFVQACILTGCDYAPNLLQGIGLVSAFKHVRSCMHKSPDERFRQVLKLLPQKAKRGILLQQVQQQQSIMDNNNSTSTSSPMDAYEELLAKSEAVFYYHPVLDTLARRVTFFTPPNTTPNNTRNNSNKNQNGSGVHGPSLARFQGDWSFLSNPQDYHDLQPSASTHQSDGGHHNDYDDDDDSDDDTQNVSWSMPPTMTTTRPSFTSYSFSLASSSRLQQPTTSKPPMALPVNAPLPPPVRAQAANKPVPSFVVLANPYRRTTNKRSIHHDNNDEHDNRPEKRTRGPLAPKSPNVELKMKKKKEQHQSSRSSKNLFSKFAANRSDKENSAAAPRPKRNDGDDGDDVDGGKQHNLQAFFDHRKKSDVRFVKPSFDANGTRIVVSAAAAAPKNKQPIVVASSQQQQQQQQHEPPPATAFFSSHAPPPFDESAQQQERDFSTTRWQQQQSLFMESQNVESESNYFTQQAEQRRQQEYSTHDDNIIEQQPPPLGLLTGFDDEQEEHVSECDDANRQSHSSFLEPARTMHWSYFGGTEANTSLPLVSTKEGFDYDDQQVETYQPEYSSNLRFASRGADNEHGNDVGAPLPFQNPSFCDNVQDDAAQYHRNNVLSSRPRFERDANSFPTGLNFQQETQEELDDNFNDFSAPPPFQNPSFFYDGDNDNAPRNDFSPRPQMGLELTALENQSEANNFVDLTETSCPPFENPAFCVYEKEEPPTRSDYFARPRSGNSFSRRVTLESPTQPGRAVAIGRLQNNPIFQSDLPRPSHFDLYDDFLSPKKLPPAEEDIDDSPPNSGGRHHHHGQQGVSLSLNLYSQRSHQPAPKAKSNIGPAKTLRNRFKSCGTVVNGNPLAKAFERQREIAAFEGSTSSGGSSRGGVQQQASQARRRRLPNLNQSTLTFSFSSTSRHG